jgi:5-methylcytosine-specific restriction endonuclease McrA
MNTLIVWLLRPFLGRRYWYRTYYLQSLHWHNIARAARRRAGYKCQRCGKQKPLDVHHKAYWILFIEQWFPFLLEAVCRDCHNKEHERT